MNPREHDVGSHLAVDMGIVGDAGDPGIPGPTIGLGGDPRAPLDHRLNILCGETFDDTNGCILP